MPGPRPRPRGGSVLQQVQETVLRDHAVHDLDHRDGPDLLRHEGLPGGVRQKEEEDTGRGGVRHTGGHQPSADTEEVITVDQMNFDSIMYLH